MRDNQSLLGMQSNNVQIQRIHMRANTTRYIGCATHL